MHPAQIKNDLADLVHQFNPEDAKDLGRLSVLCRKT
jgi:hypothetical protein